ncbi:MAG: hypothetical protein OXD40_05370 [bacterium]|nr:hypothetical protein [bacterium]
MEPRIHISVVVTGPTAPPRQEHDALMACLRDAGVTEALIVRTPAGIDLHLMAADTEQLRGLLGEYLGESSGYGMMTGTDALRRLLRSAARTGDPVLAGAIDELKESHRLAWQAGMIGDALQDRLQLAYQVARQVRSDSLLQDRPVSIVTSVVRVARSIHGDLAMVRGLLIGTEEAGEMIAARLLENGLSTLVVMHERRHLAGALAGRLGAASAVTEDLETELVRADIVILSSGGGEHTLTAADVSKALAARRARPVFLVDAGVPPDADPAVESLDDVFYYTLDHLERAAFEGGRRRPEQDEAAAVVVENAIALFAGRASESVDMRGTGRIRQILENARGRVLAETPDADAFEATAAMVDLVAREIDT